MATDEKERSGRKFDNVVPTFSSLTMLLGEKTLKINDLLEIEFMPIYCSKIILFISDCTFMSLAQSTQKLKRPLVIPPPL